MSKRDRIQQVKLKQLEESFHPLLIECLERCADGPYGLFGQNDDADPEGRYWGWPEAAQLREMAAEIQEIHAQSGEVNEECKQFLKLCTLRGSNVPGEPKLASEFLASLKGTGSAATKQPHS